MEKLRIWYTDFWPEWPQEDFIKPILEKHYQVILDPKNPSVLFHSIFNGMRVTPTYKCKKILFLGENWRPEQFGSDYSISFDPHSEKNFRLPLWQAFILRWPELWDGLVNRKRHQEFKRFCSFTVSNPNNQIRNRAYEEISEYKKVHAYGRVRTNSLELQRYAKSREWQLAKIDFFNQNPHKFSIAFENNSYPWYCTEKLMNAFLEGSLPIYWGDPKVKEDWNEKAFINVNDYTGYLDEIERIDENPEYFNRYYNQPVFTGKQELDHKANLDRFEMWLLETINK